MASTRTSYNLEHTGFVTTSINDTDDATNFRVFIRHRDDIVLVTGRADEAITGCKGLGTEQELAVLPQRGLEER